MRGGADCREIGEQADELPVRQTQRDRKGGVGRMSVRVPPDQREAESTDCGRTVAATIAALADQLAYVAAGPQPSEVKSPDDAKIAAKREMAKNLGTGALKLNPK